MICPVGKRNGEWANWRWGESARSAFVPAEGLNDRSQAIYCLEQVQSRIRLVGHGLILTPSSLILPIVPRLSDPIIPCPTGRFPFLHGYQAINCLATITHSLRDKGVPRQFAPSPFRPFAVSLLHSGPARCRSLPTSKTYHIDIFEIDWYTRHRFLLSRVWSNSGEPAPIHRYFLCNPYQRDPIQRFAGQPRLGLTRLMAIKEA
jgi:hypothetical protein